MENLLDALSTLFTFQIHNPFVWSAFYAILTIIFITITHRTLKKVQQVNLNNFKIKSLRENSDSEAKLQYETLFDKAQNNLKIYDDGDMNSIYNENGFAEKMVGLLQTKPSLEVKILFNEQKDTEFTKLIKVLHKKGKLGRVIVGHNVMSGDKSEDIYVKIVDDGKLTHLSKHELGSNQEVYELWACKDIAYLDDRFKRQISNFDELFATAELITSSSDSNAF